MAVVLKQIVIAVKNFEVQYLVYFPGRVKC